MKPIIFISLCVLASACSNSGDDSQDTASAQTPPAVVSEYTAAAPSTSYAEAHSAAAAAMEEATASGHAWSTAGVFLAQAVTAAADGDEKLAIQLADKARVQADLSIRQAQSEASAWVERVLSD